MEFLSSFQVQAQILTCSSTSPRHSRLKYSTGPIRKVASQDQEQKAPSAGHFPLCCPGSFRCGLLCGFALSPHNFGTCPYIHRGTFPVNGACDEDAEVGAAWKALRSLERIPRTPLTTEKIDSLTVSQNSSSRVRLQHGTLRVHNGPEASSRLQAKAMCTCPLRDLSSGYLVETLCKLS